MYSRQTGTILMSFSVGAYTDKLINRLSVPDLIIDITIGPVIFRNYYLGLLVELS